jgi:hypothetical protein
MKTKPNELYDCMAPDEVAECMEGVDGDLYKTLWGLVEFYGMTEKPETPDTFYGHVFGNDLGLPYLWDRLGEADKVKLNELAEANNKAYEAL